MKKIYLLFVLMLGVALFVSACTPTATTGGNPPPADDGVKEVAIQAYKWGFDQTPTPIKVGDKVRIIFTSREGVHGLSLPDFNVNTKAVSPGDSPVIVDFVADKSGTFTYFCNTFCGEGHAGMKGTLTVEP